MRGDRGRGGGGWGQSLPPRDIEDGAEMRSGGTRQRQKEGNTNRIFLGVSQLINSLEFERKMGAGGGLRLNELNSSHRAQRVDN